MEETKPAVKAPLAQLHEVIEELAADAYDTEHVSPYMQKYLTATAMCLAGIYDQLQETHVQVDPVEGQPWDEQVPTLAQGVALARFMRPHFQDPRQASAFVSRGTQGLGLDYLHVRFNDGMEGGIDREGRVST